MKVISTPLQQRIVAGVSWSLLGNIVWRLLSALSMIGVARLLGGESFGELGMVRSTVEMFAVFASFRLGSTATKYVAEFRSHSPRRAGVILQLTLLIAFFTCLATSLVCFFSSHSLSVTVLNRAGMSSSMAIGSVFLFVYIYGMVMEFALAGFEAFRAIAFVNILRGVLACVVILPLAWQWGVDGVLVGLTFNAFVVLVIFFVCIRAEQKRCNVPALVSFQEMRAESSILFHFALPGVLSGIILAASLWFGRVLLVNLEDGYQQLGVFSAANQWRTIILFLPAIIGRVLLPVLSETYGNQSADDFSRLAGKNIFTIWAMALPLTIIMIGCSDLLALFFGNEFTGLERVLPLLLASVFFYAVSATVSQVLDGAGRRWQGLVMNCLWAVVFLLINQLVLVKMGAVGFALSFLVSYFLLVCIQFFYLNYFLTKQIIDRNMLNCLVSILLLAGCLAGRYYLHGSAGYGVMVISILISLLISYERISRCR